MASQHTAARPIAPLPNTDRMFRLGMTTLRVGFGFLFLTNGIAKLPGQWDGIHPFPGFLITWRDARGILASDTQTHPVGIYKDFIDNVVLAHWNFFGSLLTITELTVGVLLILGLFTPIAALVGAGFSLHLNFAVWDRNVWAWEYAVEWLPLLGLALMRGGRYWGADARLMRRFPRWPVT